ncbi:MAG: hypothetical protein WA116_05470 [Anaerolineaceae bacterium]
MRTNQHPSGAYIASPAFANYQFSWLQDGIFVKHIAPAENGKSARPLFEADVVRRLLRTVCS